MHGWTQNGLQQPHFGAFCRSLRSDFQVPTQYFLNKYRKVMFQESKHAVETKRRSARIVVAAFDSLINWKNHLRKPTLAISFVTPYGDTYLSEFHEVYDV